MHASASRRRVALLRAVRVPVTGEDMGFGRGRFGMGPFGEAFPMPLQVATAERELMPGPVATRDEVAIRIHGFGRSPFGKGPFGSGWTIDIRPAQAERMEY